MDLKSMLHAEDAPDGRKLSAQVGRPEKDRPQSISFMNKQDPQGSYPPPIRTSSHNEIYNGNDIPNSIHRQSGHTGMRTKIEPVGLPPSYEASSTSGSQGLHSFPRSTSVTYTPTGSSPGSASAHSSFQRPTSSHSVTTPNSASHPPSSYPLQSPSSSDAHFRPTSQTQYQYFPSQPHTPLGPPPPSVKAIHGMAPRDSPSNYPRERHPSGGSNGYQPPSVISPTSNNAPQIYAMSPPHADRSLSNDLRLREKSISVSPKTRVESLPDGSRTMMDGPLVQSPSLKRKLSESSFGSPTSGGARPTIRRSASMTIDGLLNEVPVSDRKVQGPEVAQSPRQANNGTRQSPKAAQMSPAILETRDPNVPTRVEQIPPSRKLTTTSMVPQVPENAIFKNQVQSTVSPAKTMPRSPPSTLARDLQAPSNSQQVFPDSEPERKKPRLDDSPPENVSVPDQIQTQDVQALNESTPPQQQPIRRKPRRQPTPIFAKSYRDFQKADTTGPGASSKAFSTNGPPGHINGHSTISASAPSSQGVVKQESSNSSQPVPTHVPVPQPATSSSGPLGPWEPSILNVIPLEEVVKVISDFLFAEVVLREGIGVGPAGGLASKGAVLEIEAKIGRLIDRNTNDRLRLPVMTECVVSQSDPNLRISFESSMTEAQHRALNKFLNGALVASQAPKVNKPGSTPPPAARIPISYKHTHETDTFFELSQKGAQALPPAITANFNPQHKSKTTVRITHDQRTGKEIAKIVKARVADIDVYSPRTLFDYRISVNVEMNFEGSMEDLVEPERQRNRKADRNKDRMSYKHLAYQIDLTQVTPTEGQGGGNEKEHELEIEVSSAEIRRQGNLAREGQVNQYEELIRGFVDNVRVLARHCQASMG